jgi:hypothetical protein
VEAIRGFKWEILPIKTDLLNVLYKKSPCYIKKQGHKDLHLFFAWQN